MSNHALFALLVISWCFFALFLILFAGSVCRIEQIGHYENKQGEIVGYAEQKTCQRVYQFLFNPQI